MDLNRVTIIGRMTRDPEVRTTPNGKSVASVSIATGRQWKDQAGQVQKESEFHNVVLWGRLADLASQYLRKASQLYVEGRLKTRDWTGQDGVKRYRTEIIADNIIMLGSKTGSAAPISSTPSYSSANSTPQEVIEEEIKVEDIPF